MVRKIGFVAVVAQYLELGRCQYVVDAQKRQRTRIRVANAAATLHKTILELVRNRARETVAEDLLDRLAVGQDLDETFDGVGHLAAAGIDL